VQKPLQASSHFAACQSNEGLNALRPWISDSDAGQEGPHWA